MIAQDQATLEAHDIVVEFDGVSVLEGVDFTLRRGEILGLIGPNGAGKTTLVNVLSGFQRPKRGRVVVAGRPIKDAAPHQVARMGVSRTFQSVRLFRGLSVRDNIEAAAVASRVSRHDARRVAQELLERMGIADQADKRADALAHGDERRLGVVRALAMRPLFLLLDEPAAGLDESETDALTQSIRAIRDDFECGVLVIEHDVRLIMQLCERIHVLDYGKTISVGSAAEVRSDPRVIAAYLGAPNMHA